MNKILQFMIGFGLCGLFYSSALLADSATGAAKAKPCFACHGTDGNSTNGLVPTLAGQQAAYLSNQITAFRDNKRSNPIMPLQVKDLSDDDIAEMAAYFAGRNAKGAGGDTSLAKVGAAKATQCSGCHGGSFAGRGGFPKLAGQQPAYLAKQLHNFKAGARKSGPMQAIAATLSDADIEQLAAYLGSL